jgi:hypothetical protein
MCWGEKPGGNTFENCRSGLATSVAAGAKHILGFVLLFAGRRLVFAVAIALNILTYLSSASTSLISRLRPT